MKTYQVHKCGRCGKRVSSSAVKCSNSLLNGCDQYFCLILCWPHHFHSHDAEWEAMSENERNDLIHGRTAENG